MLLSFFSAVAMLMQKSVFPENDLFNLKLYISRSLCQTFSNKKKNLKMIIVSCSKKCFILKNYSSTFLLLPLKFHLKLKRKWKIAYRSIFWITPERFSFGNLRYLFVTIPLLLQANLALSICCLWTSKYRARKSGEEGSLFKIIIRFKK